MIKIKGIAGKPKELKKVNRTLILDTIRKSGNVTRGDIVNKTGISHTTVRSILKELIEEGEIISIGLDQSTGGRRAERYSINSIKDYNLVILLEENKIIYNVNNSLGKVVEESEYKIKNIKDVKAIMTLIDKIIARYRKVKGIGISVPGIVEEKGFVNGTGLDNWSLVNIREKLISKYNIPIILENDLNAATLGYALEYYKNSSLVDKNLVYIHMTTLGVGAGIMVNGEVIKGKNNLAGEIGILPIGKSYVNEILLGDPNDKEYISLISTIIKTVICLLNIDLIVLGGNDFRYKLIDDIKVESKLNSKLDAQIISVKDYFKSGLKGMNKIIDDYIKGDLKIVGGNYE